MHTQQHLLQVIDDLGSKYRDTLLIRKSLCILIDFDVESENDSIPKRREESQPTHKKKRERERERESERERMRLHGIVFLHDDGFLDILQVDGADVDSTHRDLLVVQKDQQSLQGT